jgi:hypothetical protein
MRVIVQPGFQERCQDRQPGRHRRGDVLRRRAALTLAAVLVLGGCSAAPKAPETGSPRAAPGTYVSAAELRTFQLPAPPTPGSAAQAADEAAVLAWHGRRTDADCARADTTFFVSPSHFWGERSPFPQPLPAEVEDFFGRVDAEIGAAAKLLKATFRRPRPEAGPACPGRHGHGRMGGGYSYPSTHAAISRVFALVLADLVPERRAELLAAADAIAHDRLVIGVHYPSDLAAGKALAEQFHAALLRSRAYRKDLARVAALLASDGAVRPVKP